MPRGMTGQSEPREDRLVAQNDGRWVLVTERRNRGRAPFRAKVVAIDFARASVAHVFNSSARTGARIIKPPRARSRSPRLGPRRPVATRSHTRSTATSSNGAWNGSTNWGRTPCRSSSPAWGDSWPLDAHPTRSSSRGNATRPRLQQPRADARAPTAAQAQLPAPGRQGRDAHRLEPAPSLFGVTDRPATRLGVEVQDCRWGDKRSVHRPGGLHRKGLPRASWLRNNGTPVRLRAESSTVMWKTARRHEPSAGGRLLWS